MNIWLRKHRFVGLLIIIIIFIISTAEQNHGHYSLISPNAPSLSNSMKMGSGGATSTSFTAGVGGISFDQIARPEDGFTVSNLSLQYNSNNNDGKRLEVILNNVKLNNNLYDWYLIPLIHYASSSDYSVFTLFGQLEDDDLEQALYDAEGRIMNYHQQLQNTLLGLRMYQMDILILYEHATDLPKEDGKYILGAGETAPDVNKNKRGLEKFYDYWDSVIETLNQDYRSWIISDYTRDITFNIISDSLYISETPYFHFWRYEFDKPDFDETKLEQQIIQQLEEEYAESNKTFRDWVIDRIMVALNQYENDYPEVFGDFIEYIISLPDDTQRRDELDQYTTNSLYSNLLVPLLLYMAEFIIDPLTEFSQRISDRDDLLRNIYPEIWETAVRFMRYAAFFRFCKMHFPEAWQNLLADIQQFASEPILKTPTAMYLTTNTNMNTLRHNRGNTPPSISGLDDIKITQGAEYKLALDRYVNDENNELKELIWQAQVLNNSLNKTVSKPVIKNNIKKYAVSKNPRLKASQNVLNFNKLHVSVPETSISVPSLRKATNGLSITIDETTRVAKFYFPPNQAVTNTYSVEFTVYDPEGLSDRDTLDVTVVSTVSSEQLEQTAKSFRLYSNYPNPFNASTSITFEIAKPGEVEIVLLNIQGEYVKTLIQDKMEPGIHHVNWDATDNNGLKVPSGIYINLINVIQDNSLLFHKTQKLILIK